MPSKAVLDRLNLRQIKLTSLMTGENTKEHAEDLYQEVAKICTDESLEDWEKLYCLFGETGKPCKTLQKDVNDFFDTWVIEKYLENHPPKFKERKKTEKGEQKSEEERKSLLSDENENDDEKKNKADADFAFPIPRTREEKRKLFEEFKSTLSWWERWKIDNIEPAGKKGGEYWVAKGGMQRSELLRKMQKRLTAEDREFIRKQARAYHDLLANSGLPLLHIAIKNESVDLVRAYLCAVMAFAPFSIKTAAIKAPQHQNLHAFYYAMTHSTTDMIKMFMQTVLESEFLFLRDKEQILQARRPDTLKNGTYGIGAFYMAMALGDVARADTFMSTLLEWDPNCKVAQQSNMKVRLLQAHKSYWYNDTAKYAARERGHKKLLELHRRYLNSSHLSSSQKNNIFACSKDPVPKLNVQPPPKEWTEEDEKLKKAVLAIAGLDKDPNMPKDPVKISPTLSFLDYTKVDYMLAYERRASLLRLKGKPVPEHLQKRSVRDCARAPFRDLKDAGDYARLLTVPEPDRSEKRRTDGDIWIGVPPAQSKEAKKNTWEARAHSGTLPPRSSSYASGAVELPVAPRSLPILPKLDELSPRKLAPGPERRPGQPTGFQDGSPTRLASEQTAKPDQLLPGNSPISRKKDLRRQQPGTPATKTGKNIPM